VKKFPEKLRKSIENNPKLQAIMTKNDFIAVDTLAMNIDMNSMKSDYRRVLAERWCLDHAEARWRRRVIERIGDEKTDQIVFEFENSNDADSLRDLLVSRRW
jgi:hypothetical protein